MDSRLIVVAAIFAASLLGLLAIIVVTIRRRSPRLRNKSEAAASDRAMRRQLRKGETPARRRPISVATLDLTDEYLESEQAKASPPVTEAGSAAIAFRRHFPPLLGAESRSFFGGLPRVRNSFAWPLGADGKPLHFILQIDLAHVPASRGRDALPDDGLLLLFMELEWGAQPSFHVLHDTGGTGPLHDFVPPHDIAPAYGDAGVDVWPWALEPQDRTPILPQWPFDPVAVTFHPDGTPDVDALLAVQGEDIHADPFGPQDFEGMANPWPGFPHDWLAVQIASAQLVREAERVLLQPPTGPWASLSETDRVAMLEQVQGEARAWFDHAVAQNPFEAVGANERGVFWQWFAAQAPLSHDIAPQVFEAALETSLHAHPPVASRLPVELLLRLIHRHALVMRIDDGYHPQVPARLLPAPAAIPPAEAGLAQSHILLLELASDPAIGLHFGEAIHRFWITPGDLAAR
ncbi:MAG: hypothetical protein RIS94_2703, partial [Pseudomonadota bacterium]